MSDADDRIPDDDVVITVPADQQAWGLGKLGSHQRV